MKYLTLTIFCFTFFVSCKKETDSSIKTPKNTTAVLDTTLLTNAFSVCISYDTNCLGTYYMDVNHDSIGDFKIEAAYLSVNGNIGHVFSISGISQGPTTSLNKVTDCHLINNSYSLLDSNFILVDTAGYWDEYPLHFYLDVPFPGPGQTFQSGTSKYVGLRLDKNNQFYNGWVKLDWDNTNNVVTIHSYAVQKYPGVSIITGNVN